MPEPKKVGFLFIPGFADWEYGLLSASAAEWFGAATLALTPDGKGVSSMSGFALTPARAADASRRPIIRRS